MSKVAVVFGIILLALLLGGLFVRGKTSQKVKNTPTVPTTQPANPQNTATSSPDVSRVEINYTDKGFNPPEVTVKKGTIIVFFNKAAKGSMLVEATPSSAFVQPSTGDVYSFIPNAAGTWNYRNRLNPTATGTITAK